MQRALIGLGLTALAFVGCERDRRQPAAGPTSPSAPAPVAAATPPPATAPAAGDSVSGTVVETMDAGGYTYAKLDRGTSQVWVAGPETQLAVGTMVGAASGSLMTGFRSDTLGRTFDEIYFIASFPVTGGAPPNPHTGVAKTAPLNERIEPAAGGLTIAQVFADKATLAGKPVVVRGKVVKLNNGILGRNWLHLQDGTGTPGTHDLTVTSTASVTAAVGDVVVVRGTIATNKDFGAGYNYDVIVENATLAAK